jgi:hypothetical protein
VRRFITISLVVALILLTAEASLVFLSAHPALACGVLAPAPNTLEDTFARPDQLGWGTSVSAKGVGACP